MTKKILGIAVGILALIYAVVFVVSGRAVFSISNPFQTNTVLQHKKPSELKIGVSLSTLNNPFFILSSRVLQKLLKSLDQKFRFTMGKIVLISRAMMLKI